MTAVLSFLFVSPMPGIGSPLYGIRGSVSGVEVLDKIVAIPRDERDNPLEPVEMTITVKE